MHKLIEYVCDELKALEKKASTSGTLSVAEVEYADTLAHLKKNLLKGEELMGEGGEMSGSMRNGSYEGSYRGSYANRGSYDGGSYDGSYEGGSYEGGSYARGRGRNAKRDSMGRYSSERGYSRAGGELADKLREMMDDAPDEGTRREIERLAGKMESM